MTLLSESNTEVCYSGACTIWWRPYNLVWRDPGAVLDSEVLSSVVEGSSWSVYNHGDHSTNKIEKSLAFKKYWIPALKHGEISEPFKSQEWCTGQKMSSQHLKKVYKYKFLNWIEPSLFVFIHGCYSCATVHICSQVLWYVFPRHWICPLLVWTKCLEINIDNLNHGLTAWKILIM